MVIRHRHSPIHLSVNNNNYEEINYCIAGNARPLKLLSNHSFFNIRLGCYAGTKICFQFFANNLKLKLWLIATQKNALQDSSY
jgi:hypothetical protein